MHPVSGYLNVLNEVSGIARAVNCMLPLVDDLVIIDRGSMDGTWEIVQVLAKKSPKIRIFSFPQTEARYCWNEYEIRTQAVELCLHDWVFTLDGDEVIDLVHPATFRETEAPVKFVLVGVHDWTSMIEYSNGDRWYPIYVTRFFNRKLHKYSNIRNHCIPIDDKGAPLHFKALEFPNVAIWHFHDFFIEKARVYENSMTLLPLPRKIPFYSNFIC